MPIYPSNVGPGLFLPTTQLIDTQAISQNETIDDNFKQVMIRIVQAFNDYAYAINLKDTGMYNLTEFVTGQVYFPNPALTSTTAQAPVFRQVFRSVVNFGALPNTANKAVAHGLTITANTTFTAIYATATNTAAVFPVVASIPIPITFAATGNIIDLRVDSTNVNIETTFNATAYNVCYVVLEYIKN
jgi:hypothetical protein